MSVTTDSIDVTAMRVGRALVYVSATFAISRISSFTCASVRPMSVTTDSVDITAVRVGRALVYVIAILSGSGKPSPAGTGI